MNFTRSYGLNYAPTVGSGPQVNASDSVAGTYVAANEGVIDVPSGSATGTSFEVPFGAVGAAKSVFVQNAGPSGSVNVALNGATGSFIELPAGGSVDVAIPTSVSGHPVVAVAVAVGAVQPGLGSIRYIILGQ